MRWEVVKRVGFGAIDTLSVGDDDGISEAGESANPEVKWSKRKKQPVHRILDQKITGL